MKNKKTYKRQRPEQQPQQTQVNGDYIREAEADNLFEGRHAVMELLNAEKTIHRIFIKQGEVDGSLRVILAKAKEMGILIAPVSKDKLDAMSETGRHQGVIALCPPFEYANLTQVLVDCTKAGETPFLLVLDKIFDPHNFGAIIRTALASGVHGIIIPKRRAVGITAAVVRASAGAAGHLPIIRVSNIAQAIDAMKKAGIWIGGADMEGKSVYSANMTGPLALVIGNEAEGISRLIKDKCDFLVSLPMEGPVGSLNASVAAGVLMYEVVRNRGLQK
ncbi:MAG: 23S rRNA (guanosine(2251)-2'-O)-methyltransferase RlmB [Defluviitaleaceae bacterium]|nr:23S rRNA (guanosine(2251)-2'-O)-methyltransferase RlmB [Defluviitaleaceae bacterium]